MFSLVIHIGLAHLISTFPGAQITEAPLAKNYATLVKRDDICGRQWQPECFLGTWSAGPGALCLLNTYSKDINC